MTTKRPVFLEGVAPSSSAPRRASEVPAGEMRQVAWAMAPLEHASPLPMRTLSAPPPPPLAAPPSQGPGPGFEPLTSASPPLPLPIPSPLPPPPASAPGEQSLARLEAALSSLRLQGEKLAEQMRSDALEVGLLVARRILEREISTNLEALFSLIKSAVRRVGEAHATVVRVSSRDFARLKEAADSAFTLGPIELRADEGLDPGDVMVDTEHHTIDGRLKTRLEEIGRALGDEEA